MIFDGSLSKSWGVFDSEQTPPHLKIPAYALNQLRPITTLVIKFQCSKRVYFYSLYIGPFV